MNEIWGGCIISLLTLICFRLGDISVMLHRLTRDDCEVIREAVEKGIDSQQHL